MSPLRRQSTIFLLPKSTEELNPGPFWTDGVVSSAFHEDPFGLFEDPPTLLEGPPTLPADRLLPAFDDDNLGPPSAIFADAERVNYAGFASIAYTMPFGSQSDDLFDPVYQTTYTELFENDSETCVPAQTMATCEIPSPASVPCDDSVTAIAQTLADAHLSPVPVDPSTMTTYPSYFDHGCDPSQVPSTPGTASVASPPPTSPSVSSPYCNSSELDGEGDTDYVPPSEDDEEYRPTQVAPSRKQRKRKATSKSKSRRHATFSPARSTSSESEKSVASSRARRRSHPYGRHIPSRNFQCDEETVFIDKESNFHCPVVGCDYVQANQRIPDLKRHVTTHDRWRDPERWMCCGVGMDRAHLYGKGIKKGMTEEEQIKAGAYMYNNQLMIGGCKKTFARRDALKRHVDNPNIPCVGHMDTYFY